MAKILLADDDEDMREICSRFLTARGHELHLAVNAADAVKLALTCHPELILMDMRMPEKDGGNVNDQAGLGATKEIRAVEELKHVPIVALTGHNMRNFKESILAAGCCEVFPKPIQQLMDLEALIKRNLKPAPPAP